MSHLKKIKFIYHNHSGGLGTTDIFYCETLIIDLEKISYKKEWEVNKSNRKSDQIFEIGISELKEKKIDFSWKTMVKNSELTSSIIDEIGKEVDFDFDSIVCDGDSIKIVAYYEDGTSKSHSYSYCAYDDMRKKYNRLLTMIIPKELPIPDFIRVVEDD